MAMDEKILSELDDRISQVWFDEADPAEVENDLNQHIRYAKQRNDEETVDTLRLMLGELYFATDRTEKARRQYRSVLKHKPQSAEAMIGISDTYSSERYAHVIEDWLDKACSAAEEAEDWQQLLNALDHLGWRAVYRKDYAKVRTLLDRMCELFRTVPIMDELPLSTSRSLIEADSGTMAVDYMHCYMEHALSRGYLRGALYILTRHYVEAYRQSGMPDEHILGRFQSLKERADTEETIVAFNRAVERAFKPGQYPIFEKNPRSE